MQLSHEQIQEMKDLLEKNEGREFTWQEASDAAYNLAGLADLMFDVWREDRQRQKKLEEYPKGFVLDGVGYTCFICGNGTREGENWYDKWGIKCSGCQRAIDRKEIPASLAKNKDSWYSKYDLESAFNLKGTTLRAFIKRGILKSRTITHDGAGSHYELFLIKDNKDTLPPKHLVKSHMVRTEKEDGVWHQSHPWYHFVDPREHLKGYKILEHITVIDHKKDQDKSPK